MDQISNSAYFASLPMETAPAERAWQARFYLGMPRKLRALVDEAASLSAATPETVNKSIALIDHTSLEDGLVPMTGKESQEKIEAVCRAATDGAHAAAVCVYPNQIGTAKKILKGTPVRLAVVHNFPHGDASEEDAVADIVRSAARGAQEIDTVIDYQALLAGDVFSVKNKLAETADASKSIGAGLKIILKASVYPTYRQLRAAAEIASGVEPEFVKLCTGKKPLPGYGSGQPDAANLLTAATVLHTVAQHNRKYGTHIGVKVSGGIRNPLDCEKLRYLVSKIMGDAYYAPETMRIGASSLLGNLKPESAPAEACKVAPAPPGY